MNLTSYGTPLEKDVASPLHYPLSHAGDRGSWIHHSSNRGGRNNQMVVICTIAVVAVSEKTSSGRSVVNNASVALLLDLPEVISLAGAMEEVFLTWHAMAS